MGKLDKDGRYKNDIGGASLTRQSEADKQDINKMSSQYLRMRYQNASPLGRKPIYGSMPSATYHEMMNAITRMDNQFNQLPPRMRARFKNRPEIMLAFLEDDNNRREALKMGLIVDPELEEVLRQEEKAKQARRNGVEQVDLVDESGETPESEKALQADEEAQPAYKPQGGAAGLSRKKGPGKGR